MTKANHYSYYKVTHRAHFLSGDDVNLCKGCGAMKHLNDAGYCGRCKPTEAELRREIHQILDDIQVYWLDEELWSTPMKKGEITFEDKIMAAVAQHEKAARKQTASDIFNLAHQYAQDDETMVGSEELRSYHYYNAIAKIGEFDGR